MKKLFNRALSVFVSAIIAVSAVVQYGVTAYAVSNYTVQFFDTVENGTASFVKYNDCAYTQNTADYTDVAGIRSVLSYPCNGVKSGVDIPFASPVSIADNSYVEIEFDYSCKNSSGEASGNQSKLMLNGDYELFYILDTKTEIKYDGDSAKSKLAFSSVKDMKRFKTVLRAVTVGGARYWQMISFKVNGTEMFSEGRVFTLKTMSSDLSKIRLRYGATNDAAVSLDNISVVSYTSADGSSPVPDRYALFSKIQKTQADAQLAYEEKKIVKTDVENVNSIISEAEEVLFTAKPAEGDINTAFNRLDSAYSFINTYNIKNISVQNTDSSVKGAFAPNGILKAVTISKPTADAINGNLIFSIYGNDGLLKGAVSKPVIDNGTASEVTVEFDGYNLGSDIRSNRVTMYLWDNENGPVMSEYRWSRLDDWTVYYNGYEIMPDTMPIYETDGEIYVGAKYLLNLMGITLERFGDEYCASGYYRSYIKYKIGDENVKIRREQGAEETVGLSSPILCTEDGFSLLPLSLIFSVFGGEVTNADDINNRIDISYTDETYSYYGTPTAYYTPQTYSADYAFPYSSDITDIEVWYKPKYTEADSTFINTEYNNRMDTRYWHRAIKPMVQEGYFKGSLSYLKPNTKYSLKYVVRTGNSTSYYLHTDAFTTKAEVSTKASVIYDAAELTLKPTYENISYYVDYGSYTDASSCEITYRKSGGEWKNAYQPFMDTVESQFRGSIVKLEDNTQYEVKSVIKNASGTVLNTQTKSVKTWSNEPNIALNVKLDDVIDQFGFEYDAATKTITEPAQLIYIRGSADNWIKLDCTGWTIDAGNNHISAFSVDNCEYLIVDGLTVKGGYRCGIAVNDSCNNVRLSNCDISGFGKSGIQRENGKYYRDGSFINYDAGILMLGSKYITVEKCYIHDAVSKTNSWENPADSPIQWSKSHPQGVSGIYYLLTDSCVIRYNDIIGNEEHRWNDGIEGLGNSRYTGAAGRDSDIYGNMIAYGQDDGIELDGGQMNIRVYQNRFEQFLCGISLVTNLIGPSYIFENVLTNLGTESKEYAKVFKVGGAQNKARSYVFNNTCYIYGVISENISYNGSEYNFVTRNNILVNTNGGKCYENTVSTSLNDNDYDFCYGRAGTVGYNNGGHSKIYSPSNLSLGAVPNKMKFVNYKNGVFNLNTTSECYKAGTYIDNFCEIENPNIGALQGANDFMPYRPADIYADKYYMDLSTGSGAVTVKTGAIPTGTTYTVEKAEDMQWLEVTPSGGAVSSNGQITLNLSVKGNASGVGGVVMFKLSNGYSVPISVKIK